MGQIFLIRHGQASLGSADYDQLSALGVAQSRLLGEWFRATGLRIDRVVVGGLRRHSQTAEACLAELPAAPVNWEIDAGFAEFDHDDHLLRHWPPFAEAGAVGRYLAGQADGPRRFQQIVAGAMERWSGGAHDSEYAETWDGFHGRCAAALERLLGGAARSQNIVVFTSGGPVASICGHLLGLDRTHLLKLTWSFVNGSVTKLLYGPDGASLSYLNSHAHLEWLGGHDMVSYR